MHCRQHPWFSQHLPRYLAVIQADTMATSPLIDTEMVDEVVKLGFDRGEVIQSVKARQQNKVRLGPAAFPSELCHTGRYACLFMFDSGTDKVHLGPVTIPSELCHTGSYACLSVFESGQDMQSMSE